MAYQNHWEENGLCRVYTGMTSGDEVLSSNLAIQGDARFAGIHYVINDFTRITEFIVGKVDILNIAATDNLAAIDNISGTSNSALKIAIIAVFEPLLEWIYLYIDAMRNSPYQCRYFTNLDNAYQWVNAAV